MESHSEPTLQPTPSAFLILQVPLLLQYCVAGQSAAPVQGFAHPVERPGRIAKVRTDRLVGDPKRLLRTGRRPIPRRRHPGHAGDRCTEPDELLIPVGVLAVELVAVELGQPGK